MSHVSHHPYIRTAGMNTAARGFTLVELMVVVAIAVILAALAVPQFSQLIGSRAIDAQVSAVLSSMRLARSEALKRATPVTICPTSNPEAANPQCTASDAALGWGTGWLMFSDLGTRGTIDGSDTIIRVQPAFPGSGGMRPTAGSAFKITFTANGIMMGQASSFELKNKADPTSASSTRCLIISAQGSTRLTRTTC